jgi:putrescine transport system substrate-binding protein
LYNQSLIDKTLPAIAMDSWRLLFDPAYASKLSACGISFVDDPPAVVKLILNYLGKDPESNLDADFAAVQATLLRIRPFIRSIDTGTILDMMTNGDSCIALDYSSDAYLDRQRATEAGNGVDIRYVIPKEGSLIWMNWLAIPRDAPNRANAHRFINHLLDAQMSASFSNRLGAASANLAAIPLLDPAIRDDALVYPTPQQRQRLFVETGNSAERARTITRIWQRFKTGQ